MLLVVPLFATFDRRDSDWATIYDFAATPIGSAIVAVAHAGVLGAAVVRRRQLAELEWAFRTGRREQLAHLHDAIAREPTDVRVWQDLVRLYFDGLQPAWAGRAARDGLAAGGDDPVLYAILGGALIRERRFEAALEPLARATELAAGDPQLEMWVRANRAIAHAARGETSESLLLFDTLDEAMVLDGAVTVWHERARAELAVNA